MTIDVNDAIEGFRAQRNENADKVVEWFAKYMAEKRRADDLAAELEELKKKAE